MKYLIDLPPYVKEDWEDKYWDFRSVRPGHYIHPEGYLEPHKRFIQDISYWKEIGNHAEAEKRIKKYDHGDQITAAWLCAEVIGDQRVRQYLKRVEKYYQILAKRGREWAEAFPQYDKQFILEIEARYRIECRIGRIAAGMPPKGKE